MINHQKRAIPFCNISVILFSVWLLIIVESHSQAQSKILNAPAQKSNVIQNPNPAKQPPVSITKEKETIVPESIKRLNITSASALKKDFTALRQGDYSIISLQLPGSNKESDYYVKKSGYKLILNGDITVLDLRNLQMQSYTKNDENHIFIKNDLYRWTNGTVPVVLTDSVYVGDNYNIIKSALDYFNFNTGIVFKERTDEQYYLVITCVPDDKSGKAGSTQVGRQKNGSNILELINGKFSKGVVLHELMHTLGVLHEQARSDRDNFVEIKWNNIKEDAKHNFQIEGDATARSAYDYCSIMQYPQYGFAIDPDKPTLVCRTNGVTSNCPDCVGKQDGLTKMDLDGLKQLYAEIGINRAPSNMPFVASNMPVAGCIGVDDKLIKAKWDYYKTALGSCQSLVISMGIFNSTYVQFERGMIYHTPRGIFVIYGNIYQLFKNNNTINLGLLTSDEEDINDASKGLLSSWQLNGYTRISRFENGVIAWGPKKDALAMKNEKFAQGPNKSSISEKASPTPVPQQKNKMTKSKSTIILEKH